MAKLKRENLRKRIEKDLKDQLVENFISGYHYEDLVQDYLSLWDLKCRLIDDIERNGIQVKGMHGPKSNPSIGDLHKTNDRMLRILSEIGIKPSATEQSGNIDDDDF
ncbi:P27 family phage terminase small subunit [Alkalihalobacillus pseudalcaliphilus]|uniref:P27 family phage terminase small subunit n=1 Tax=Alkalihalobacillus pseudalcaliphilus TaxID=79884 RepID=UPI00064DBC4C|nr:P27 family phage terminase small subunit [Alkalihalobacillus pseudalcaliphilus]KMK77617.1 hypothetical protein AB990_03910 [Alkalihalobacillus pseudalcaliphilus]